VVVHVHEVTLFGEACACKSVVYVDCRLVVHCVDTFNFLGDEGVSMDECLQFGAEGGFLPRTLLYKNLFQGVSTGSKLPITTPLLAGHLRQ
jgi:hypothetical protein